MAMTYSERTHFIVICSITSSFTLLSQLLLPLVVGILAEINKLDAGTLGLLAFFEIGGSALTGFAIAIPLKRFNPAILGGVGAFIAAAANIGSAFTIGNVTLLLALRLISGLGIGLKRAGTGALAAGLPDPEQMFSILGFAPCVMALIGFAIAPWLIETTGGAAGMFMLLGLLSLLNATLLFGQSKRLNGYVAKVARSAVALAPDAGGLAGDLPHRRSVDPGSRGMKPARRITTDIVALNLLLSFVTLFADSFLWNFVVPFGKLSGIPLENMNLVLMVVSVVCCIAPIVSARMGLRFGWLIPLLVGEVCLVALSALIVTFREPWVFTVCISLREAVGVFLALRFAALAARADNTGGLTSAIGSAQSIGTAVGPLIGGQMVLMAAGSYKVLGLASCIGYALCLLISFALFTRSRHLLETGRSPSALRNEAAQ